MASNSPWKGAYHGGRSAAWPYSLLIGVLTIVLIAAALAIL